MSRSGYSDDGENLAMWRGQVASAIRGKRGQAFLRELIEALDAIPEKRLIKNDLQKADGAVCAIGSVAVRRGIDMAPLDIDDPEALSRVFGIAPQLVAEIEYMNDEGGWRETPEQTWSRMRAWAVENLRDNPSSVDVERE